MNKREMVKSKKKREGPDLTWLFPLSWTFRSEGYINTNLSKENKDVAVPFHVLTINVITEDGEEVENAYPTVYPCSPNFKINNWSIVEILVADKLIK